MSTIKDRVAQRATGRRPRSAELQRQRVATVRHLFTQMKPQFQMALPKHVGVDRFLRMALTCVQKNPQLLNCTQESLLAALLEAARLGLEPGTRQAAIVPYKQQATLVVQWQGLVELMYRSGRITSVVAEFIHEGDEWEYRIGDGGGFWHRPNLLAADRGEPVLCYAFAEMKGGGRSKIVVLTRRDAEEIRDKYSKAYAQAEQHRREDPDGFARHPDSAWFTSVWHSDFNAMWRKSAVRRLADWVPQSPELLELLQQENPAGEAEPLEVDLVDGEVVADVEEPETAPETPAEPQPPADADWPPVTKPGGGGDE